MTLARARVEDAQAIAAPLPIDSLAEVSSVELGHESTGFVCHVNDNTAVDISRNIPQQPVPKEAWVGSEKCPFL